MGQPSEYDWVVKTLIQFYCITKVKGLFRCPSGPTPIASELTIRGVILGWSDLSSEFFDIGSDLR